MELIERIPIRQLRLLTLSNFHRDLVPNNTEVPLNPTRKQSKDSQDPLDHLKKARNSFASTIPIEGNSISYSPDRAAVLEVYQQALQKITAVNRTQLQAEVSLKIKTILCLRDAQPDDIVFYSKGMILPPLEPQYAEPRIEFIDDECGYTASKRLNRWRRDGWPAAFPKNAVAIDRQMTEKDIQKEQWDWAGEVWVESSDAVAATRSKRLKRSYHSIED